jgi:hypothetical protein
MRQFKMTKPRAPNVPSTRGAGTVKEMARAMETGMTIPFAARSRSKEALDFPSLFD